MKALVLAIALVNVCHANDFVRISTDTSQYKYSGTVTDIIPQVDDEPAVLYFSQQSAFPVGGGGESVQPPQAFAWTVMFTNTRGQTYILDCMGLVPAYDGRFTFHLYCDRQPGRH